MRNFTTTDRHPAMRTALTRGLWFVGLWCAGVVCVGAVALVFHVLLLGG